MGGVKRRWRYYGIINVILYSRNKDMLCDAWHYKGVRYSG